MRHPHSDQLSVARPGAGAQEPTDAARAELTAIVVRAQAGDLAAQSELVRLYSHRIAGFVRGIVHQPEAIEDITQSVFIKMVRRLGWLREAISFEAWLFAMARSTALDHLRSRRRRPECLSDDPEVFDTPDQSRPELVREISEALENALTHLSPTDRTLVTMVVEGHSYQTIAAQERLTVGAVKARLARVRPFLRAAVGLATGTRLPDVATTRRRNAPAVRELLAAA